MQNVTIEIKNKRAKAIGSPSLVCNNSDYKIKFIFDDEWADVPIKTARLVYSKDGQVKKLDLPFEGDTVEIPKLGGVRDVRVGVYAGDLKTTTPAWVPYLPSILCSGGVPDEPSEDVYSQIMELFNKKVIDPNTPVDQVFDPESENPQSGKALAALGMSTPSRISYVTLIASAWEGEENLYSQVVNIDGATENSQVDLTPSVEQLAVFYNKDLAFVTENDNGVVTVYAIGQKPQNDYTIQVTLTEVLR